MLLAVFHLLLGLTVWSLLATTSRGPGAVGEMLVHQERKDIEESHEDDTSVQQPFIGHSERRIKFRRRERRTGSSNSRVASGSSSEEEDYYSLDHEMRTSSSEESDYDENEGDPQFGNKVQIIYPGRLATSASALMAKSNGKARFCRKVSHSCKMTIIACKRNIANRAEILLV